MASSSSASDNSDLDLGLTFGALEIAIILSSILFGVVTTQTYTYHKNFPADSRWIKYLVNILWLAELGQTICTFHYMYYWSVTGFGNPAFLAKAPVTLGLGTMFYGICVALVQGYFTYRLFKFTSASSILVRLVPITLVVFISARFGVIIAGAIEAIRLPYYMPFVQKWRLLIVASQSIGTCTDVMIMLTLVLNLRQRRVDAYQSTVAMVDKLILWAIETGALTSIIGIAILVCLLTMRDNFVWLALLLILPKIFSNTLLANLNSRADLRRLRNLDTHVLSTDESSFAANDSYSRSRRSRRSQQSTQGFSDLSLADLNTNSGRSTKRSERHFVQSVP